MLDQAEPSAETLIERARVVEEAALAVPGVTNSEGAEAGWGRSRVVLAASNGFVGGYCGSSSSFSVSVLSGSGTQMERDYDFSSAVYAPITRPGGNRRNAGEKAVKRLGARKISRPAAARSFRPRVSRGMLSHLLGSISGRRSRAAPASCGTSSTSASFPRRFTNHRDPPRPARLPLKPFDAEGIANRRRALIDKGRWLTTWLLDLRSARQLGLTTTGHAARGNLFITHPFRPQPTYGLEPAS